jgi:hypothetical protein
MKALGLVFIATSLAALPAASGFAISPGRGYFSTSAQSSAKSAGNQRVGDRSRARAATSDPRAEYERPPEPNLPAKPMTLPLPKAPKAVPKTRQFTLGKGPASIRESQPARASDVPKAGAARSQRSDKLRPAATPIVARSAPPSFQNGSHRVSNPALGSPQWRNAGVGSIVGARIRRKP